MIKILYLYTHIHRPCYPRGEPVLRREMKWMQKLYSQRVGECGREPAAAVADGGGGGVASFALFDAPPSLPLSE